ALVERWRPETHTFHLSCGECTVTLEDVALQLGLPIDGNAITGAVRAYIMHLIGGVLMPDANGSKTTAPSAVDMGRCLILLQSWALYRMPFLASIRHQSYVFPLVNRWSSNPSIGKSQTVPMYRLMIENHAGEGYIPTLPVQLGDIHGMNKKGRYGDNWEEVHEEYITIWNNQFGRVPQMDRAPDLQPSIEYIQWQPLRDLHHAPEPEPEPEPELEPEPEPDPEPHSRDSSYHPELGGDDNFVASYPPQYSAPSGQYLPSYSSPPGSSSSMAFQTYDYSSMFQTPRHTVEENVDNRNRPQRERRAPQKYTPRTTPSNHQF
ncbi:hypothetical protein Gotur_004307, partial [Gossypium turneri]